MEKTELRQVEVEYCDFCGTETKNLTKYVVCKRGMCNLGGGKGHNTHSIDIYSYTTGDRRHNGHLCKECSKLVWRGTIGELLDEMLNRNPVEESLTVA